MAWRISDNEFLICGRSYPIHLSLSVNTVTLPDGARVKAASEFFRVSGTGEVLARYREPPTSPLEDDMYVVDIHCVVGGSLYRCWWVEHFGGEGELEAQVCLTDLTAVEDSDVPFEEARIIEGFHARHADA